MSVIFSGRGVLSVFLTGLCVASSTMIAITPSYASEEEEQVVCDADSAQAGIYTPRADRAHPSKGDASGHGWWESSNAECGMQKRWVKNHLWAKWGGIWWKVGDSGWEKHWANGGAGKRSAVHVPCKSNAKTTWTNQAEVWVGSDLTGYSVKSEWTEVTLDCYPW